MGLLVTVPSGFEPERRYVIDTVLRDWFGIQYKIRSGEAGVVTITRAGQGDGRVTMPDLFLAGTGPLVHVRRSPSLPLRAWSAVDLPSQDHILGGDLPVLFGETGGASWSQKGDHVHVGMDIFGSVFYLLTEYWTHLDPKRDMHGRVRSASCMLHRAGLRHRPLANEYVELLWGSLKVVFPDLERERRSYRVRVTHDIDRLYMSHGKSMLQNLRAAAGGLVKDRRPDVAAARLRSLIATWLRGASGDLFNTFDHLMSESERRGLASTFYFLAGGDHPHFDRRYDPMSPDVAKILQEIDRRGHQIGIHLSHSSHLDDGQSRQELELLQNALHRADIKQTIRDVRQHYLRFSLQGTWRLHERLGLERDSSRGFHDDVGFPSGTCYPYRPYDLDARRPLRITEYPLILMDGALLAAARGSHHRARRLAYSMVAACRLFDGEFVILWHNSMLYDQRLRRTYAAILDAAMAPGGSLCPL